MNKSFKSLKRDVIKWKQFSRKGDAIFRSLGREIIISVLSVVTLAFAVPNKSNAQTANIPDSDCVVDDTIQTVEVVASRLPLPMEQTARIVSVITHDDIEKYAVNSVNDVLKFVASVDVRQRGAFGIQTDVSINGGTHDQIIILIDGVNISSPHTGHLSSDFPLTIDDIERIEVLEGAASRVYGTSAFSGAINIITKKNTHNRQKSKLKGTFRTEAGSYGTIDVSANVNYNGINSFNRLTVAYNRSDGATDNSEFKKYSVFYNGGLNQNAFDVFWHLGANCQDFGANTFYSGKYPNQFESNQKYQGAITLKTKGVVIFKPTVYWIRALDHYQLIKNSDFGENYHMTDVYGATFNTSTKWMLGTSMISADFRNEGILSTSLGKPLDSSQFVKIHGNDRFYTKKDNRTNISYFFEHDVVLDKWSVSMGLMANMNTALDHRIRLYPGIDICFKPSKEWKLYASWNMAQRMPTFTDLYYKSPTQEGNVGLKPEKTSEFSCAANYRGRGIRSNVRLFYRHDMSLIDWILTPQDAGNGYTTYHATNFKIDKWGAKFTMDLLFDELWNDNFFINNLNISYSYINQKRFDDVEVYASSYALDYLRHKLLISAEAKIIDDLFVDISYRFQNRKGGFVKYIPFVNEDKSVTFNTSFEKYKLLSLFDIKVKWIKPKYELYIQANNITNVEYYDVGNVRQPGIWFMVGAKLYWK